MQIALGGRDSTDSFETIRDSPLLLWLSRDCTVRFSCGVVSVYILYASA